MQTYAAKFECHDFRGGDKISDALQTRYCQKKKEKLKLDASLIGGSQGNAKETEGYLKLGHVGEGALNDYTI